jgi:hypothetical protein
MTRDALNFGVVKTVDDNLVVRPQQPEFGIDGAGGATLGPADDPHAEDNHDQHNDAPKNKPKPSHDVPALFSKVGGAPGCISAGMSGFLVSLFSDCGWLCRPIFLLPLAT